MASDEALRLVQEPWTAKAADAFAAICRDDPCFGLAGLRDLVEAGRARLLAVYDDDWRPVGHLVYEVAKLPGGREFHLMAGAGRRDGRPLTDTLLPWLTDQARKIGCNQVRIETARPGLVRRLEAQGFDHHRHVMVKAL